MNATKRHQKHKGFCKQLRSATRANDQPWILNHWRQLCGKDPLREVFDPQAERERRYDALADHFRRHLNLDLIYRALEERSQ